MVSASVEDEARARLDVAQLYEEMNQLPKAVRYYLEAAQIYKDGGVMARYKELLSKVLQLEPGNAQAEAALAKLAAPPPPTYTPTARPAASTGSGGAAKPAGGPQLPPLQLPTPQPGKVLTPTPWLFRDPRYVASAKKQLSAPIDRSVLAFDPLPKVDPQMVMMKQEQRKKAEEEAARRANPRNVSSFDPSRPSMFQRPAENKPAAPAPGGGGGLFGAGGAPKAPAPPAQAPPAQESRFGFGGGGGRGGNQDLAEQIRRRMQERNGG